MTESTAGLMVLVCLALGVGACGSSNATQAPSDGGALDSGTTGPSREGGSDATGTGEAGEDARAAGEGGAAEAGAGDAATDGGLACKRGLAANTAPGAAFFPTVAWWYDWSLQGSGAGAGIDFVPMVWGASSLGKPIPSGSSFLLGFNEPNFMAQSNLTPQQAASDWPMVEAQASATGAALVSPAVNFCGPAAQCNGTDPYQYLKDFFAACSGCRVDYVAVHWYNCDLPSLQDYLEPGGNLPGFEQFGKPVWLTEFCCPGSATEAQQEAYMRAAIPYLEGKATVFRYSWFSADPIPNAKLVNADGTPTALGQVYLSLPATCR